MPIRPGEIADLLRAVGRLLDGEKATAFDLINNDGTLAIAFRTKGYGNDQRHYQDRNLEELRKWAKDSRGDMYREPRDGYAEMLRTLGQDLDRAGSEFTEILQEGDKITVRGQIDGRQVEQQYLVPELLASNRRRREWRRAPAPQTDFRPGPEGSPANPGLRPNPRSGPADDGGGPLSRRLGR
jgi:hypothetical protein